MRNDETSLNKKFDAVPEAVALRLPQAQQLLRRPRFHCQKERSGVEEQHVLPVDDYAIPFASEDEPGRVVGRLHNREPCRLTQRAEQIRILIDPRLPPLLVDHHPLIRESEKKAREAFGSHGERCHDQEQRNENDCTQVWFSHGDGIIINSE